MLDRLRALIRSRNTLQQPFEVEVKSSNKEEQREEWDRPIEFILSLVGCSVGLGNVWRYPYIAFKNGGGAFLIPYFCVYFLIGTPLYFLELSLGQFTSRGATVAFKMSRLGWAMAVNSFLVTIYYNIIIAWCLFYFFASFRKKLPWSDCGNWWNTESCSNPGYPSKNATINFLCLSTNQFSNCSLPTSPPEEYFDNYVLRRSNSLEAMGSPHWSLVLCLLLAWILVAACIIQGIKSSGKVVYFTSLFPYVVIFALVIRGVTLPGAANGISFYLKPNWNKVREFDVWIAAASQVTFSLSVGFGSILGYASFNKFKSNYLRDCIIVTACDCFTSVFAGFAVFPILGFMSYKTGLPVDQVAKAGPGLAFIAYPQALSIMPGGPFWAFALSDVTISGLLDTFTSLRRYKTYFILGYCVVCFLLALPMCTPFMEDVRMMLDKRPLEPYWFLTWCISGPIITLIVFFSSIIQFRAPTEGKYVYSTYTNVLGWLMVSSSIIFIPGGIIYELIKAWKATHRYDNQMSIEMPHYLRALTYASQPDKDWGPARKETRYGRYEAMNQTMENDSKPNNGSIINDNENVNEAFDPELDMTSRF
ncbi:unnamed protein product [Rotaria sp. Silwood2]|nr:unnamed protein product [Rotaria sp. Silwood2]CAF2680520.1 unnamed protein product [Rotaria sp. Silwood2]CAF2951297.1 unnamed protein product [Rotaria sp. Silwood2]CAF4040555.1 unnamed protein product [Rotaria sp. Silwood2]CAF4120053.1 unnamed protein product [Rotaria sp. Silwood2]